MKSSATLRLTSPSSSASRISPSAASRCSALSFPCPRRFLKALCNFSVSVSNMILRSQHRSPSLDLLRLPGESLGLWQCLGCSRLGFLGGHETADLRRRHGLLNEVERSLLLHLSCCRQQTTQGDACEHAARANPAYTGGLKLRARKLQPPTSRARVDRRRHDCAS